MLKKDLEERVALLEAQVGALRRGSVNSDERPWWEKIRGRFKDDPAYEEAMRLGREYREATKRPSGTVDGD